MDNSAKFAIVDALNEIAERTESQFTDLLDRLTGYAFNEDQAGDLLDFYKNEY